MYIVSRWNTTSTWRTELTPWVRVLVALSSYARILWEDSTNLIPRLQPPPSPTEFATKYKTCVVLYWLCLSKGVLMDKTKMCVYLCVKVDGGSSSILCHLVTIVQVVAHQLLTHTQRYKDEKIINKAMMLNSFLFEPNIIIKMLVFFSLR